METNEKKQKKQVEFTLLLPKERGSRDFFKVIIRDIDEDVYTMARSIVRAGKEIEAVKFILQELHVGGDNIKDVLDCFYAVHSASSAVLDLLTPEEVNLKKN